MITTLVVQNNINCNDNDGGNVVMLVSINHIYDDDDIGGGKTILIMERNTVIVKMIIRTILSRLYFGMQIGKIIT